MQRENLIACVLRAHEVLVRESDLSPRNPEINAALSTLVQGILESCADGEAERVLADPGVRSVRNALLRRLALAEGAMERYWAEAFCRRERLAAADFETFPYWDCYRYLVQAELGALAPHLQLGRGESVAFVGSGPLPLSAIMMHIGAGVPVTCIDIDPEACGFGRALCRKADITRVHVTCAGGAEHDYARHPLVLVASLVPDKAAVVRRIRATRRSATVALRSAEGLRTLLYDPVDEAELRSIGCRYLGSTGDIPRAINTTLLYEADPRRRQACPVAARDARRLGAVLGLPLLRMARRRARPATHADRAMAREAATAEASAAQ